jgi:hypothetical protein
MVLRAFYTHWGKRGKQKEPNFPNGFFVLGHTELCGEYFFG